MRYVLTNQTVGLRHRQAEGTGSSGEHLLNPMTELGVGRFALRYGAHYFTVRTYSKISVGFILGWR
jgi:hypothetical protein